MAKKPDYWRQLDIVSPDKLDFPITVIGCGGIGSPTIMALAKMGVKQIEVFDPDIVENHNLPNQLFRLEDIGKPKAEAIAEIVSGYSDVRIAPHVKKVEKGERLSGFVISGVDSMDSRKLIWSCLRLNPRVLAYVDGRMGAEIARIFSVRPTIRDDVLYYERYLVDDSQTKELPCTARSIIYNVFMISALIANQVKKFAVGQPLSKQINFDLKTLTLMTSL